MPLLVLALALLPGLSIAAADCSEDIALFDARIADKPDDQLKQIALGMRQSLVQTCGFLAAETRAKLIKNLDELYPPGDAGARSAELEKFAASTKQIQQQLDVIAAEQDNKSITTNISAPPSNKVIAAPPGAHSVFAQHLLRPDKMRKLTVHDWDVHNNKLRILYVTKPDREQYASPDWRFNIYVAEVSAQGSVAHRLIDSQQANDHGALALRRGYDEVFVLRHVDLPNEPTFFERWSSLGSERLSKVNTTLLRPQIDDYEFQTLQFGAPTSDGHLMLTAFGAPGNSALRWAWFKVSMMGDILSGSELPQAEDKFSPLSWITTSNGGAALIVHVSPNLGTTLHTGPMKDVSSLKFPATLRAVVHLEKRIIAIDSQAGKSWESEAVERMIMFEPKTRPAQVSSLSQMQSQLLVQQQASDLAAQEYAVGRTVHSLNINAPPFEMIKQMGDVYAVLLNQTANRNLQPPIHGPYLVKIRNGRITQALYLEPLAKQLEAKFTAFEPRRGGDDFYLLANNSVQHAFVVLLNADGSPLAYSKTAHISNFDLQRAVLVSDGQGVWVLGDQWRDEFAKSVLWVERFEF